MLARGKYSRADRQWIIDSLIGGKTSAELAKECNIPRETIEAWDEEESARKEMEELYDSAISSKDTIVVSQQKGSMLVSRLLFLLKDYWVLTISVLIIILCVMTFCFSFNKVTQRVSSMSQNKTEQQLDSLSSIIGRIEVQLSDIGRNVETRKPYSDTISNRLSALSDDVKLMRKTIIHWNKQHHQWCNYQKEESLINQK